MKKIIQSDVVFTNIGDPISNGGIEFDANGKILAVYNQEQLLQKKIDKKYKGFLVPGFVNSHCHLELSFAVARIEKNKGINNFIERVEFLKKSTPEKAKIEMIGKALEILKEEGIVAVGDICNTELTANPKKFSSIKFRNFIEVYGINSDFANKKIDEAIKLKVKFENSSIVPHSTYSLSSELFKNIENQLNNNDIISIHNQESAAENEYFQKGSGEMFDRFKNWNLEIPKFIPSKENPLQTISKIIEIKDNSCLFVHNTFSEAADFDFINQTYPSAYICICPSSNLFIENTLPKVEMIYQKAMTICIGTDSLASTDNLSLFNEMMILIKAFPNIPFTEILKWATINGGKALGFAEDIGSFEVGKTPGINLIEDVDVENIRLTDYSFVRVIK